MAKVTFTPRTKITIEMSELEALTLTAVLAKVTDSEDLAAYPIYSKLSDIFGNDTGDELVELTNRSIRLKTLPSKYDYLKGK